MELGDGIHESKGERTEAKGEAEGASEGVEELGRPLLEAQGAGRRVEMEVGVPSHAWRPRSVTSNTWCASRCLTWRPC